MTQMLSKACLRAAVSGTALLGSLAIATTAHASGYQLREVSGTLQGSSFAGMSTSSADASTIFFNPANIGQFDQSTYSVGGSLIMPKSTVRNASANAPLGQDVSRSDYGDMAQDAFVPNAHAVWKLTDNLNMGISLTSPWGLVTDYEDDFAGRFFGTTSSIKTANVKPALAYRFDNGLALGAGLQIQYMDARLARAVITGAGTEAASDVTGDDVAMGWSAGMNWEVVPGTRIGASYTSDVTHHLRGDIKFGSTAAYNDQSAKAKVTTPEFVTFGIAQDLGEKWTIMADAQWTNWTSLTNLTFNYGGNISNLGTPVTSTSEYYNWSSAWFGTLGARYQYDENWAFTGGIAYDQTPVKTEHRSVRLPDSNRYWVSLGTSYKVNDWADVSLGYTHIFAHEAHVNVRDSSNNTFSGDYDSKVDIIALQAKFQF
ncbi:OmpP1/FadL family transporter [Thalassospira lucentensis]|uniref:OmpP1/FadL family transporter n=1 Tax=Thalassospira lucentensis TaxID=168935 RepID=UPI0020CA3C22|nr:OmpP1/FadL family transporter [Thalassospira lucentensis]